MIITVSHQAYNSILTVKLLKLKSNARVIDHQHKKSSNLTSYTIGVGSQETCRPSCMPFRMATSSSANVKSNTYGNAHVVNAVDTEKKLETVLLSLFTCI